MREDKGGWFGFKSMLQKGIDKAYISEYVKQLKQLGFSFEESVIERYPTFYVAILNDEEKFSLFSKYTLELSEKLK